MSRDRVRNRKTGMSQYSGNQIRNINILAYDQLDFCTIMATHRTDFQQNSGMQIFKMLISKYISFSAHTKVFGCIYILESKWQSGCWLAADKCMLILGEAVQKTILSELLRTFMNICSLKGRYESSLKWLLTSRSHPLNCCLHVAQSSVKSCSHVRWLKEFRR